MRIAIERGWDLRPREVFATAYGAFEAQGAKLTQPWDVTVDALEAFVADRLAFHLAGDGVGAESAAAAQGAGMGGLAATSAWALAIQAARGDDSFWLTWEACNRCTRVTAREAAGTDGGWMPTGDAGEQALADAVSQARPTIDAARAGGDFRAALAAGAALAPAVDTFFVDVMVNAEDPLDRSRRHALVRETAAVLGRIADFTVVTQGGTR